MELNLAEMTKIALLIVGGATAGGFGGNALGPAATQLENAEIRCVEERGETREITLRLLSDQRADCQASIRWCTDFLKHQQDR